MNITRIFFLLTVFLSSPAFAQESNPKWKIHKPSLSIETTTRGFQNYGITIDYYQPITNKLSFSSWSSRATAINKPGSSTYTTSLNYLNYAVTPRLTVSVGQQYLKNSTFKYKVNTLNIKARLRIF